MVGAVSDADVDGIAQPPMMFLARMSLSWPVDSGALAAQGDISLANAPEGRRAAGVGGPPPNTKVGLR